MPRQEETPGGMPLRGEGGSPAAVRRAVVIAGVSGDPGSALTPGGGAGAVELPVITFAVPSEVRPEPQGEVTETAVVPVATVSAATAEPAAPAVAYAAAQIPPNPDDIDAVGVSTGPKRPMLAAAAIAGALLIAVPFVLWGFGHGKTTTHTVQSAADNRTVLAPQLTTPPGDYTANSPSAAPSSPNSGKPSPSKTSTTPAKSANKAPQVTVVPTAPKAETQAKVQAAPVVKPSTPAPAAKPLPPVGTAAYAVVKLAASSPGRHVCYRAHVAGIGWQAPVCDGAMAGTTGQNLRIEALNIATAGTNGTSAAGYVQNVAWQSWTSAATQSNLTIGTTGQSLRLEAFSLRVGTGTVCVQAHVQNIAWQSKVCASAGNSVTAGTTGQALRMEAVRITV